MNTIFICGIFMAVSIALLLFTKKHMALTDRILASWVAIISIHLMGYYCYYLGYWESYPHLIGITAPFPLFYGPMLYLYTVYSLRQDDKLRVSDYLHFIPVVISYLYMFEFFFFYTPEEKKMVDLGEVADFDLFMLLMLVAFIVSGLAYSIISYRLTWQHKRKVDDNFSYKEGISLNWLRNCIWGIGIIFLVVFLIVLLRKVFGYEFAFNSDYILYLMIIVFISYLGYHGIRHQNMFTHNIETKRYSMSDSNTEEKYKKSGLKNDILQKEHQNLLLYMEENKPFLDPKLSLYQLAGVLNISPNKLSQIINQQEEVNFHDFINRYRVNEFILRVSMNSDFSLLAHAFDSGFNSKSSFNSVFKKITGMTPSQYIVQINSQSNSH